MNTLNALEAVVDRHGRDVLSDPIALTGALRSLPDPPAEDDIVALAAAAGAGAVGRMHAVLAAGGDADEALRAAVDLAGPAAGDRAGLACGLLGAALGFLPRDAGGGAGPTAPNSVPSAAPAEPPAGAGGAIRGRRRAALVTLSVIVALGVAGGAVAAVRATSDDGGKDAGATRRAGSPAATAPRTSATPRPSATSSTPADPRDAFTDPKLLAVAEPYLAHGRATCTAKETGLGQREDVNCVLDSGAYLAVFSRVLDPHNLPNVRKGWLTDNSTAEKGTIRILRWEYVPGRPGVRRGIPFVTQGRGDGIRIRWVDAKGRPYLYFDEDATGVTGFLSTLKHDQQLLRDFWEG